MANLSIDENCPICYEMLDEDGYVEFVSCSHKLCKLCFCELLDSGIISCPLDRIDITSIIYHNKTNEQRFDSHSEFFKYLANHDLVDSVEEDWICTFTSFNNEIKKSIEILTDILNLHKTWLVNKSKIDDEQIKILESIISQFNPIKFGRNTHTLQGINKYKYFSKYNIEIDNLFFLNLKNSELIHLEYYISKISYHCLNVEGICQRNIVQYNVETIESNLKDLRDKQLFINYLLISFLRNNESIYQLNQPDVHKEDINKCLICLQTIDINDYSKFMNCDHKICLCCSDKFLITHGSCPFDGNQLEKLILKINNENMIHRDHMKHYYEYLDDFILQYNKKIRKSKYTHIAMFRKFGDALEKLHWFISRINKNQRNDVPGFENYMDNAKKEFIFVLNNFIIDFSIIYEIINLKIKMHFIFMLKNNYENSYNFDHSYICMSEIHLFYCLYEIDRCSVVDITYNKFMENLQHLQENIWNVTNVKDAFFIDEFGSKINEVLNVLSQGRNIENK